MNFKIHGIIFCFFCVISLDVNADSAKLNFSGVINQPTCNLIQIGDITIDMKEWETDVFTGPGSITPAVPISISLSCDKGTKVSATLTGSSYDSSQGIIQLTSGVSSASGLGIQLLDISGKALYLNTPLSITNPGGGLIKINWQARYIQVGSIVTSGDANSVVTVNFSYN